MIKKTALLTLLFCLVDLGVHPQVVAGEMSITPQQTYDGMKKKEVLLIDVREKEELTEGMAEGAQWFPFSKIKADSEEWKQFTAKLPKDKKIVSYCAVGGRAGKVSDKLTKLGFATANMGGFSDWQKAHLPIKKPINQ